MYYKTSFTMYNKLTYLLIALLITSNLFASKDNNIIKGKIIEKENGKALPYATISVQGDNLKIIGGTTTNEEGKFTINNIEIDSFMVKISFIGFKDTTINVNIDNLTDNNLGIIALSPDASTLKAAVITEKIPVIEHKVDKIIMNVSEAVSTQGSSTLDILRKAPGISVDPSGNILLNGNIVQIWIDNRPSNLTGADLEALLSSTDGSTIDKIEIIAHPSAKYDAEGSSGIVNIKTKKNFAKGLSGSLRATYGASPFESELYNSVSSSINLAYRGNKSNTTVNYSPKFDESYDKFTSVTNLDEAQVLKGITLNKSINKRFNFRVSHDYYINKQNIIGVIISGLNRNNDENTDNDITGSKLYKNGTLIKTNNTSIDGKSNFNNIYTNLNYTHIFKDNHEVTVNADYGYYDIGSDSHQENKYFNVIEGTDDPSNIFSSNSKQYLNIVSAKLDYEQLVLNKIMLEVGGKWAQSQTDNNLKREDFIDNVWVKNDLLSSKFNYKENIVASYISAGIQFGPKLSAKAGIRAEYTISNGDWISADTTTQKKYLDIFPTLFLGFNPNKNTTIAATYNLRIQRPNFSQLNPFRIYVDANTAAEGNPNLLPQYTHQASLSLIYKHFLSLGFYGQFNTKTIIQNTKFNSVTGEKLLTWENFGNLNLYGGVLNITELPITKWLTINSGLLVAQVKSKTDGYEKKSLFSSINMNAEFSLPKDTKIELSGLFQSGIPYGYFKVKPQGDISLGIKKGVLKNRGTLILNCSDLLLTQNSRAVLATDIIKNYRFKSQWKSREISISFLYHFGNGIATKARKVGESEEAKRAESDNAKK